MKRYALSAIGRDRPGIVAAVTKVLFEHDCNIEDSSMSILEDEFAVILIMSAPDTIDVASLSRGMKNTEEEMGLTISLKEIEEKTSFTPPESNYIITLHGADTAGIVYKTARFLSEHNINVTDLETKTLVGGGKGKNIYIMVMEVFVPKDEKIEAVREGLERIGEGLGVSIKIRPLEAYEPL